jgi:hypothetical protein
VLDVPDKLGLLSLRLLIARAAQKDSLGLWEDDSLTQAGSYLLDRLFLADPIEAGRMLALEAARTRYQAAFNGEDTVLHLFHLDKTGEVEHGLQGIRLTNVPVPSEPITTQDALRQNLLELTGEPPKFHIVGERANHRFEISVIPSIGNISILNLAKVLAWATLEGKPGQPIFPYISMNL